MGCQNNNQDGRVEEGSEEPDDTGAPTLDPEGKSIGVDLKSRQNYFVSSGSALEQ